MLLNHPRKAVLAEFVGTATLVMTVVGSGIAAQRLTDDIGVELLINALATVAALGVLIAVLLSISGAHLNPVVTLVMTIRREIRPRLAIAYVAAQLLGGVVGTLIAHGMYERAAVSSYHSDRGGFGTALGEVVATAGLVLVVLLAQRTALAWAVPAWIGAAYFFTSSTSFANPAVTVGRAFTDSFAGIRWADVPFYVLAQVIGGLLALALARALTTKETG
jgi:glycerol uptake facilitator-like aquaporin